MRRHARPKPVAVQLSPMQVDDIEAVLAIEHDSFTMPWTAAMFRSELLNERTSRLLVARTERAGGAIVGYIAYRIVLDEMHVILLAVPPAWRQRGIATQMLQTAMEQARVAGCLRATLEVRVSNTPAQQLYYRLKFAPVGTRPKYYLRPTEDALILWRDPL
ncbi:MAG: ribosomal protein S18-alanine N-acetyltransferase [Candidatus Tectimicrobiota bacterium]